MLKKAMVLVLSLAVPISAARAQVHVGKDSATRLLRFGRDVVYGTAEGLAFAEVDQLSHSPPQWGNGWNGYGKRAASNVGEFLIQEGVTEGLAAALNRPLDYEHCTCKGTGDRIWWAIRGGVTDVMPGSGARMLAVPRIAGAFAGSFAQAAWRPDVGSDRTRVAVVNALSSLGIGVGINLWHEFVR
jgi:hypothetical protein